MNVSYPLCFSKIPWIARLSRLGLLVGILFPIAAAAPSAPLGEEELSRLSTLDGYPIPMNHPVIVLNEEDIAPEKRQEADALRDYLRMAHLFYSGEDDRAAQMIRNRPAGAPFPYRTQILEIRLIFGEGKVKEAANLCRKLVSNFPDQIEGYLLLADLCAEQGDNDAVIETLEAAHKAFPRQEEFLQRLHRQCAREFAQARSRRDKQRHLDRLEELSEEILDVMPGRRSAPYARALSFIKMEKGDSEAAIELTQRLILLEPKNIEHYIQLSKFYEQAGDSDGVLAALRRASVVNPAAPALARRINALFLDAGRPAGLLDFYRSLATEYPGRRDIQLTYAKNLAVQSQPEEATRILRDSLQLQPDNSEGWWFLAELEFGQGHRDLGVEALGHFSEHAARTPENLAMVVQTLLKFDAFDEAASRLEQLKKLDPDSPSVRDLEMRTALQMRDREKALGILVAAVEAHPEELSPYLMLFRFFDAVNQPAEAIPFLRQGIERATGENAKSLQGLLVGACLDAKLYDEAVSAASAALESDPANWRVRLLRLRAYLRGGQKEKVEPELVQVLKNHRDEAEVQYEVALIKWDLKQFDDAAACLRRAIALKPDFAEALNSLGYLFAERDSNLDEALELVRKALDLEPGAPHMIDSLGWVYYKRGEYAMAAAMLEEAASKTGNDPVVLDHLGDAYLKLDRLPEALEQFRRALGQADNEELAGSLKKKIESLKKR